MKFQTHLSSALPALILPHGLLVVPGAISPDLAWYLATSFNGFKKPEALSDRWMLLYRFLHSWLPWAALAAWTWNLSPLVPGYFAGVAMHLILDFPVHSPNLPLWPLPFSFDGCGA